MKLSPSLHLAMIVIVLLGIQMMSKILLEPFLDIVLAEELKRRLLDGIEKAGELILDASKVERITTPCIQLFIVADQELSQDDKGLKIVNATDAVVSAFQDIGLEKMYQRWSS